MVEIIKWTGEKISRPCIVSDMPIEVYHSDCCDGPSVSSSGLRTIVAKSPAEYWDSSYLNPKGEPSEETKALLIGRAVHHLILGQSQFKEKFVVQPEHYPAEDGTMKKWTYGANYCKRWREDNRKRGRSAISAADAEMIAGIAKSLARHEFVKSGLLNGLVEHSIFWRDSVTGIWLKIRPDSVPNLIGASVSPVDLKTVEDTEYETCRKSFVTYGYHQQCALICQGLKEVMDLHVDEFTLMFCAKKRPFTKRPWWVKEADIADGDEANRVALDVMQWCLTHKEWPEPGRGPGRDIVEYLEVGEHERARRIANIQRLRDTFGLKG